MTPLTGIDALSKYFIQKRAIEKRAINFLKQEKIIIGDLNLKI